MEEYSVLAGTPNLLDDYTGQRRDLKNCTIHPEYKGVVSNTSSDIAICKLSSPLKFNERVNKVEINPNYIGPGVNCTLTGWGGLSQNRTSSSFSHWNVIAYPVHLQTAVFPTISNDLCNQMRNT